MHRAVIALGSNIRPEFHIPVAILQIEKKTWIIGKSEFVSTRPVGNPDQPDFINGVLLVETGMNLPELAAWLHDVEDELGRIRTPDPSGPRTIDLDVAVWDGQVVHRDVLERDFLKKAVLEVLPDLMIMP
jgi:2-amino-4-hydroxy-6-hydroxymethyldihydropteridine diphosphokinase